MKKAFALITLLLCFYATLKAQEATKTPRQAQRATNEIDVSYYNTHIGSNIAVEYNRNFGKHTLVLGIKCHLNPVTELSGNSFNNYVYRKHFYARKFSDFIGASLGYEYHLPDINPYVSPYLFYNLQYAHMQTRHLPVSEYYQIGFPVPQTRYDGPFTALENIIGGGLSIKLSHWLSLNQSAGMGIPLIYDHSRVSNGTSRWDIDGILAFQWRMGLTVSL